jgi:hypothetical protein
LLNAAFAMEIYVELYTKWLQSELNLCKILQFHMKCIRSYHSNTSNLTKIKRLVIIMCTFSLLSFMDAGAIIDALDYSCT